MKDKDKNKKKLTIQEMFRDKLASLPKSEEELQEIPLFDATDTEILMHREVHFGGKFEFMLDHYRQDKKGSQEDFKIERIQYLAEVERQLGQNIAALLLSAPDAERIAKAKEAYKQLSDLYDMPQQKHSYTRLIADLILAEKPEDEEKAIAAVIKEKGTIVPGLIELIRSEDFYDTLFPGYGLAPLLAVQCLGKIGDKRSLISLFEAIGQGDFFSDDAVLDALFAIGEPAKSFLLKVVEGRPLNEDNEKAAIALVRFKEDPQVSENSLRLLQQVEIRNDIVLSTYLLLTCEGLKDQAKRNEFVKIAESPDTSKDMKRDIKAIANAWKESLKDLS